MEFNKSLSARIKRRNKSGFCGLGTHSFPKEVNISINDEIFNHKYEDKQMNDYQKNLVNYAKKHGYSKHAGSKRLEQLKRYI